jgi:protein-ribulosamine 3-kinase
VSPPALAAALSDAIAHAIGEPIEVTASEPVGGGCIHSALAITAETAQGKRRFFAKALEALRGARCVRVPGVLARGKDDETSWLVLEWLDLAPLDERSAASLGTALAAQHRIAQERFGWARDNFIGATPQVNGWSDDWLAFWRAKRLHAQLRLAAHNRLPSRMIDRGERLVADCEVFFRNYRPAKSLLHGDLWSGNAAALADGTPIVFDPAVYVGDREADVAMTELFGGFPRGFAAAYRAAWALDDGYTVRRELYNVYHVLNHANLFAGRYVGEAQKAIERLLAEIS